MPSKVSQTFLVYIWCGVWTKLDNMRVIDKEVR